MGPLLLGLGVALAEEPVAELVVEAVSEATRLERSAEAVRVLRTEDAQQQSADLGEVLARSEGVSVQRGGGLGSEARLSLGGLSGDQVRVFLDGLPLDLSGFPTGLANVPVDLIDRVEIYRGVVPIRFGADALGGAINLVSEPLVGPGRLGLSYQGGSFDTHRLSAFGHVARGHAWVGGTGWLDATQNDYPVEVEVADELGHLSTVTARRFHDAYRAGGGAVQLGLQDQPWADHLSIRGFASHLSREIQNNVVMSVPYGEPLYTLSTGGATARWQRAAGPWSVEALLGGSQVARAFLDLGECAVDWFGQCVAALSNPGEISAGGADQVVWDSLGSARVNAVSQVSPSQRITASLAPAWFSRTGEDRRLMPGERDPLQAQRDAAQLTGGLEHQLESPNPDLQNVVFAKIYLQHLASEEPIIGGGVSEVDQRNLRAGIGESARLALSEALALRLSYEWATRLPTPEEAFGDGVLVQDNLSLRPESSHNVNLDLNLDHEGRLGAASLSLSGLLRQARDLIVLLGQDRSYTWQNVTTARALGLEAAAGWRAPRDALALSLNSTLLDMRNISNEGAFADYAGDRIPNRPWLLANAALGLGVSGVATPRDRLSLNLSSRYVHAFTRGWESVGFSAFKQVVPAQLSHSAALIYAVKGESGRVSGSVEVQNLSDALLTDFFGVQRPGRAVFGKFTVSR